MWPCYYLALKLQKYKILQMMFILCFFKPDYPAINKTQWFGYDAKAW